MKRRDLEHLIRAAAAITNEHEIVVVGSLSIVAITQTLQISTLALEDLQ